MTNIAALSLAKARPNGLKSSRDINDYFTILERLMYQVQESQGGTTGDAITPALEYVDAAIISLRAAIADRSVDVVTASDIAVYSSGTVRATSSCVITLNPEPDDHEEITVMHDGAIGDTVDVGGYTITNPSDCITLKYYTEFNKWVIQ